MPNSSAPKAMFSDAVYNKLKQSAAVLLPALQTAYFGLAQLWGFNYDERIVGTVAIINTVLGVLVMVAKFMHDKTANVIDGTFSVEPNDEGASLRLQVFNQASVGTRDTLVFKMAQPPTE